jgi:hypothetical protein
MAPALERAAAKDVLCFFNNHQVCGQDRGACPPAGKLWAGSFIMTFKKGLYSNGKAGKTKKFAGRDTSLQASFEPYAPPGLRLLEKPVNKRKLTAC